MGLSHCYKLPNSNHSLPAPFLRVVFAAATLRYEVMFSSATESRLLTSTNMGVSGAQSSPITQLTVHIGI